MILADTSTWIDHLRAGNCKLRSLLEDAEVLAHPFVVSELACGTLRPLWTPNRRISKITSTLALAFEA